MSLQTLFQEQGKRLRSVSLDINATFFLDESIYISKQEDFFVDDTYTFDVGEKSK